MRSMAAKNRYRRIATALAVALAVLFLYVDRAGVLALVNTNNSDEGKTRQIVVKWVIDGDTVELVGGERIRYVGIDTPEREEPFYKKARTMNVEILSNGEGTIYFEPCASEYKDKYGRLLGWVRAGEVDVGERLLTLGLAKTLTIPPCGLVKVKAYKEAEAKARALSVGLWKK